MKWPKYWVGLSLAFLLFVFLFSPFSAGAQEVTLTQAEYQELTMILDELDTTVATQKSRILTLRVNLTQSAETIKKLNASLAEAEKSLRAQKKEATKNKIIVAVVACAAGLLLGQLF